MDESIFYTQSYHMSTIIYIFFFVFDVLLQKFPNSSVPDFMLKVSRWFSGAIDREGGKKKRLSCHGSIAKKSFSYVPLSYIV